MPPIPNGMAICIRSMLSYGGREAGRLHLYSITIYCYPLKRKQCVIALGLSYLIMDIVSYPILESLLSNTIMYVPILNVYETIYLIILSCLFNSILFVSKSCSKTFHHFIYLNYFVLNSNFQFLLSFFLIHESSSINYSNKIYL